MGNHNRYFADISSNNPEFDAKAYKLAGHVLVAIKATEGTSYVNPNHRGWCYAAGLRHIGIVHYHFARPDLGTAPEAEAAHFLRVVHGLAGGRDYLCLDMERGTLQRDPQWTREFDSVIQRSSRFHTVLYSSRSWLQESDEWLVGEKKRVWDADWSVARDWAPAGYSIFARQYTDGINGPGPHEFAGIGRCDGNVMSGPVFQAVTAHLP